MLLLEQQKEAQAEKASMMAQISALHDEMNAQEREAISAEELATLQARVQALHDAQLLADEELFVVEDLCADFAELQATVPSGGVLTQEAIYSAMGENGVAAVKLLKLVRLSASMASDAAFARQLKRKFV